MVIRQVALIDPFMQHIMRLLLIANPQTAGIAIFSNNISKHSTKTTPTNNQHAVLTCHITLPEVFRGQAHS